MAQVCKEGDNTFDCTRSPIIFVPGVMGSRLRFTEVNEYWDPDSNWRMSHWLGYGMNAEKKRGELHFSRTAVVLDDENDYHKLTDEEKGKGRGWPGVSWDFYGEFLRELNTPKESSLSQYPVYAVGYDWRQDNRKSGAYLADKICDILKKENADRFIVITHSMGGIVTRAALHDNKNGLASKVLGVLHVVQPVTGAVTFYRRLWTGCNKNWDGGRGLANIMGPKAIDFATIVSGLPGAVQLMPANLYRYWGAPWLLHNREGGPPQEYVGDIYNLYVSETRPPGGIPQEYPRFIRGEFASRIKSASLFHKWLADYKHEKTWAIYSTGLETDHRTIFEETTTGAASNKSFEVRPHRPAEGDATVPGPSAAALYPGQAHDPSEPVNDKNRQFRVDGVDHGEAFKSGDVRNIVTKLIRHLM